MSDRTTRQGRPRIPLAAATRCLALGLVSLMATATAGDPEPAPSQGAPGQQVQGSVALWQPDLGNGSYRNPVLFADYSDPDVVRVGDDFYMTASSFNHVPGLPILHSHDLVNWQLIGHALEKLVPEDVFRIPQHGNGVWAPNIRYHEGKVWIFYPDPDFGVYMTRTEDPKAGDWSEPLLILPGKGIIDPSPLWDDDGQAWLVHASAKSRSGKNNILTLRKMSWDGTQVAATGKVIIDGNKLAGYRTLEGPKFYKRNGYYYIFAPAGGVPVGWQSVFRSKAVDGPYQSHIAMEQGDTLVNGPHQGAWVRSQSGEDWFFHFQSALPYGRIVHLQPMKWLNDWPVIGADHDGDGIGNPVRSYRKPGLGFGADSVERVPQSPPTSDEFEQPGLGLQWQWNANPANEWYSLSERPGLLRLYAQAKPDPETGNLWMLPSLLAQKLPAPRYIAEVTFEFPAGTTGLSAGLAMFGEDYAWLGVRQDAGSGDLQLGYASCHEARSGCNEDFKVEEVLDSSRLTVRMTVTEGGGTVFSYRQENGRFKAVGDLFQARPGRWVGAKVGLFAVVDRANEVGSSNYVDIESIRFYEPRETHSIPAKEKITP